MADRVSLGLLGFIFGGITAIVMLIAAVVVGHTVGSHSSRGKQSLDVTAPVVSASLPRQVD